MMGSEHDQLNMEGVMGSHHTESRSTAKNNRLHQLSESPLTNANDHTHLAEEPEMVWISPLKSDLL